MLDIKWGNEDLGKVKWRFKLPLQDLFKLHWKGLVNGTFTNSNCYKGGFNLPLLNLNGPISNSLKL